MKLTGPPMDRLSQNGCGPDGGMEESSSAMLHYAIRCGAMLNVHILRCDMLRDAMQ